jgi:hypothetical protein
MADRHRLVLPAEFAAEIRAAGERVDASLPIDFGEARQAASDELRLIKAAEAASGRALHKGHPLYNLGITLYPTSPRWALRHFAGAFVEDVRTYHGPSRHLAARVMRNLFRAPRRVLAALRDRAVKDEREDPLEIAYEVDEHVDTGLYAPLFPESQPDDWLLNIPASDLVFVGGSYGAAGDRLYQMAAQIANCGLHPVIVGQLKRRPGETDREKSFRLLDLCGLAAFDGTVQERPGWWAEVEHILQTTRIPTLIAFFSSSANPDYRTSAMFPTERDHPHLVSRPFGANLPEVVRRWLSDVHPSGLSCTEEDWLSFQYSMGPSTLIGSNTPYARRLMPSGIPASDPTKVATSD